MPYLVRSALQLVVVEPEQAGQRRSIPPKEGQRDGPQTALLFPAAVAAVVAQVSAQRQQSAA